MAGPSSQPLAPEEVLRLFSGRIHASIQSLPVLAEFAYSKNLVGDAVMNDFPSMTTEQAKTKLLAAVRATIKTSGGKRDALISFIQCLEQTGEPGLKELASEMRASLSLEKMKQAKGARGSEVQANQEQQSTVSPLPSLLSPVSSPVSPISSPMSLVASPVSPASTVEDQVQATLYSPPPPKEGASVGVCKPPQQDGSSSSVKGEESKAFLDVQPTEKDLRMLVADKVKDYEGLGTMLGLEYARVEMFDEEKRGKVISINMKILTTWIREETKMPTTWDTLIQALNDLDMNNLARNITEKLKKRLDKSS